MGKPGGARDALGLLVAACVVYVGVMVIGPFLGRLLSLRGLGPVGRGLAMVAAGVGALAALGVLCGLALWLFNRKRADAPTPVSARGVRALERAGLLVSTAYRASRAFEVAELEDEGLHFFVELAGGGVLHLSGPYLYEYAPDRLAGRARQFPCSEFTVRRHRDGGYAVDLVCAGRVIEPEVVAPAYSRDEIRSAALPGDGDVISDKSLDALKAERLARRRP